MSRVRSKVRSEVKVSGHGEHARILCWIIAGSCRVKLEMPGKLVL